MAQESAIIVRSALGVDLHNAWFTRESISRAVAILFPGAGYVCEKPLLHYAAKVARQLGLDVLCLEYGFQRARRDYNEIPREQILHETAEAVRTCLAHGYEKVFFISKSLGTYYAGEIGCQLAPRPIHQLFLTPFCDTLPYLLSMPCVAVSGSKDPHFPFESVAQVRAENPKATLHILEGAYHSLELPDDYQKSLEILSRVATITATFLKAHLPA